MIPQFSKEDKKIVTDFISNFNKVFSVNKNSDSSNYHWSEVYVWNRFTIQVRAIGDFTLTGFSVEIYFDSENLDYKAQIVKFKKDDSELALTLAKKLYEANTKSLIVSALSESD